MEQVKIRGGIMKVYRVYDKEQKRFIKVGKRTNDIYVNRNMLIKTLKTCFRMDKLSDRFHIYEYELMIKKESN